MKANERNRLGSQMRKKGVQTSVRTVTVHLWTQILRDQLHQMDIEKSMYP